MQIDRPKIRKIWISRRSVKRCQRKKKDSVRVISIKNLKSNSSTISGNLW